MLKKYKCMLAIQVIMFNVGCSIFAMEGTSNDTRAGGFLPSSAGMQANEDMLPAPFLAAAAAAQSTVDLQD
jgi:hypothetical protein